MYVLDETYQTARISHKCDMCFTDIHPGDYYKRFVYIAEKIGILALKFHIDPDCPKDALTFIETIEDSNEDFDDTEEDLKDGLPIAA